jgi:hypothetical protein
MTDELAPCDDPRVIRFRRFVAALDACYAVNEPDRKEEARETAFVAFRDVMAIAFDLIAERLGAARLSRRYFRPRSSWGEEARKAASHAVAPASKDMDKDEVAAQRWITAKFATDFEWLLPPGLARNIASAMLNLNLGMETPFTKPYRVKGLSNSLAPKATVHFATAMVVHYLSGYRDCSLERVLLDETETFRSMGTDSLKSIVRRLGIAETVHTARQMGKADRLAGLPEGLPFVLGFDLAMLAKINK